MKLNNLSRLMALLMAVMLCSIPCASASGIDWSDLTGTTLDAVDLAAEMVSEENRCSICANELTTRGYTEWPVENFDCFHTYLASMTAEEAYQMLYDLDMSDDFALAQVYINAHANHVTQATGDQKKEAVICYNFDCSKNTFDTPPGPSHIQGTCPWYQETEYLPAVNTTVNGANSTLDITVPGDAFTGAYVMNAELVTDTAAQALIQNAVNAELATHTPFTVFSMDAYDITFTQEGTKVQPSEGSPVKLTFDLTNMSKDGYEYQVFHVTERNGVYTAETMTFAAISASSVSVDADSFSVYVVANVGDTTGTQIITEQNTDSYTYDMVVGDTELLYWEYNDDVSAYTMHKYTWAVDDPDGVLSTMMYQREVDGVDLDPTTAQYPYIEVLPLKVGTATLTLKYLYFNGSSWWATPSEPYVEGAVTITINVTAPTSGLYIADTIATDGCLAPAWPEGTDTTGYTYEWSRSDGAVINAFAINGDSINVAVDRGGINAGGSAKTYTVTAKDADGNIVGTAEYRVMYGNEILNASFETPYISGSTNKQVPNGTTGLYWRTTGVGLDGKMSRDVELVNIANGTSHGVPQNDDDVDGDQFAEVNAEEFGTLYQDILTAPGAILSWSFQHRARTDVNKSAQDTLYVIIAPTAIAQKVVDATDVNALLTAYVNQRETVTIDNEVISMSYFVIKDNEAAGSWEAISGNYTVPENQYLTRLFFAAKPTTDGSNKTVGNLIDAVSATETLTYRVEYYVNGVLRTRDVDSAADDYIFTGDVNSYHDPQFWDELSEDYLFTDATVNGHPYLGDIENKGLYIASYVEKEADADCELVFRLYFIEQGVTLQKTVAFYNENGILLSEQEVANLIKAQGGYEARFKLKKGDETVATANVAISADANQFSNPMVLPAEFLVGTSGYTPVPGTYTIEEVSSTEFPSYLLTTNFTNGSNSFVLTNTSLKHEATVTNAYKVSYSTLTIKKTGMETGESAIFTVTGYVPNGTADGKEQTWTVVLTATENKKEPSVTITGLLVGSTATVEEAGNWSWRYQTTQYEPSTQSVEIKPKTESTATITITNTNKKNQWLDDEVAVKNDFSKNGQGTVID